MLLGKGSSLTIGRGRGFISIIKSSTRVESLGTALASASLQAKPAWARGNAKQVTQCIYSASSFEMPLTFFSHKTISIRS